MSADKENEYFSDGLAEEIINVLAHVPGLKVFARTSASPSGERTGYPHDRGRPGVRSILEGSVRRFGSRIRVTAQLIDADGGHHLWSERYDREMADVFAIQDDIAAAIASALQTKLSVAPAALRDTPRTFPRTTRTLKALHDMGQKTPEQLAPPGNGWSGRSRSTAIRVWPTDAGLLRPAARASRIAAGARRDATRA